MANKEELFKMIKKMSPGDVMTFVAQELGVNPAELLVKNAGSIALKAVKAGWAKANGIKDAVKGFSDKTKSDDTGIDWDGVEVEEAGFKMSCLFDGDSGKKLKEFVKKLGDQMKEFAEEEKKLDESGQLDEDMSEQQLKDVAQKVFDFATKHKGEYSNAREVFEKAGVADIVDKLLAKGYDTDDMTGSLFVEKLNMIAFAAGQPFDTSASLFLKDAMKDTVSVSEFAKGISVGAPEKVASQITQAAKLIPADVKKAAEKAAGSAVASTAVDKALSGAKNFKQMQAAFDDLDSGVKKEIEDLMKQGPQGALKAADKLGKLSGGNAGAQQVLDKMMQKQDWYENTSSDMKQALNKDMYSLSLQSKDLSDVMNSGDVAHAAGDDAVSEILADKAKTPKEAVAAAGASKDAAKEMANDEEMKKQAAEKTGVKAFTPLGWARLAAKTTGYVLNHGKDVVDALGAKKIAKGEDKNVIAEIRTQIENAEGADKNYADSEFSVRFTTDDFKWHATCIDDRKMQVPEEMLVKKVLSTETGRKFKEYCLKKWKSMFSAKPDGDYAMLPFILGNIDKFGLKGGSEEFFNKVKAVADNMDKIEAQFK